MENLNKFMIDLDNIFFIRDYFIVDNKSEMKSLIEDFSNEEKINNIKEGIFSCKINDKYMLLSKNNIKEFYSNFYQNLLQINKNFDLFNLNDSKNIICLVNYVLLFNDNITFYSLKQKILLKIKHLNNKNNIIISEYFYTILTNRNLRKSSISWFYRFFLVNNFKDYIYFIHNENNQNLDNFYIKYFENEKTIFSSFIYKDIENLYLINEKESRNYHLWIHSNRIFTSDNFSIKDKKIIIIFAFFILYKCVWDHSSFCFIKNFISKIKFNDKQKLLFINYLNEIKDIKPEKNFHNYSINFNNNNLFIDKI